MHHELNTNSRGWKIKKIEFILLVFHLIQCDRVLGEKKFTRPDTGLCIGIKFNPVVITSLPTPARQAMGKKMAAGRSLS
jgi:hypothetical protein